MISFFVSLVLLLNVENSFDDKKQASSIKNTIKIIKTIHGVKWGGKMKYLVIFLFLFGCGNARHTIKVNTNPFSENFNEKTKIGYSITFGKERKETIKEE